MARAGIENNAGFVDFAPRLESAELQPNVSSDSGPSGAGSLSATIRRPLRTGDSGFYSPAGLNGRVTQAEVDALESGLDQTLAAIENNLVQEVFGETYPLVGDNFRVAWSNNVANFRYLTKLRGAILSGLATLTAQPDYSSNEVAGPINSRLASSNFIASTVVVTTVGDQVQLAFTTADTFTAGSVPLELNFGVPNLDLQLTVANNGQTTANWTNHFTVGVDGSGFYLEPGGAVFTIFTTTTISSLNAAGRFTKLPYTITDNTTSGSSRTSIPLNFAITLKDPGNDGKIRLNELAGTPDLLDATVTGNTKLALKLLSSVSPVAMLPQVGTDLELLWNFTNAPVNPNDNNATFGNQPTLNLKNNRMNLDSFFNSFAGRALKQIDDTTAPLQPVIDVLTLTIPVLSDLGSDQLTILDLFGVDGATVDAIGGLAALLNLANQATAFTGNQNVFSDLGDYTLAAGDLRVDALADIPGNAVRPPSSTRDADLTAFLTAANAIRGLQFPLLTNASVAAALLLGRDATLFSYRSGEIGFHEDLGPLFFPVLGPVGITLKGHIGMTTEFGFGYDTRGIYDFSTNGGVNPDLLFNGFYAMALDESGGRLTGIELSFGVTAGVEANVVIASVGVEGDITATIGMYLDDQRGDANGRVRGSTLAAFPIDDLFYAAGSLSAGLRAYLEIGWPPFGLSFDFESPRVVLLTFDSRDTTVPVLGFLDPFNNELTLNVGNRAPLRVHGQTNDVAEEFYIANNAGGGLRVFAFNEQMDFSLPSLIVADANLRGDVIIADADVTVPVHFTGGPGFDKLVGGAGADVLEGGDGPDYLSGNSGDDILRGGADNDYLNGGLGSDVLDGGDGLDTASWVGSPIPVFIDLRTNSFLGAAVGDTLISIERYEGTTHDDIMDGSEGSDSLLAGSEGNDIIRGHGGSDRLEGGAGDDTLEGGDGDDMLVGGPGADHLDGGDGIDTVSYLGAESPVTVSLLTGLGTRGDALGDVITNCEILMGSGLPKDPGAATGDILEGSDNADIIHGMGGSDLIHGAGGNDVIYGDNNVLPGDYSDVTATLLTGTDADTIYGDAGDDMLFGQADDDQLYGGEGNDMLDGGTGDDLLDGGPGADTLYGGEGNDHLITMDLLSPDFLDGGPGFNRLSADYSDKTNALHFTVGNTNSFTFPDGDTFTNIQTLGTLTTGSGNDVIRLAAVQEPSYLSKTINAGVGDDLIIADWRGQYVFGQSALRTADSVNGGAGNDTLSFEQSIGNVTVNLATGGLGGTAAGMTMTGFENIKGSDFTDNLTGDDGPNIIMPLNSPLTNGTYDIVDGGAGTDTLRIDFSRHPVANAQGVKMGANDGTGTKNIAFGPVYTPAGAFTLLLYSKMERFEITGGAEADALYGEGITFYGGTNSNDIFFGLGGNDHIEGRMGDDYLDGGEGDDTLLAGDGNDTVIGGPGNDVITFAYSSGGYGNDFADAGPGNDSVTSIYTPGSDQTFANATTVIKFDGGDGFDTLSVDVGHMTTPFIFNEANPPGEIILPNGGYLRNFERIGDVTTGSGNDVVILQGRFNNEIVLRGGNDILNPGLGIDNVNAGSGGDDLIILDYSVGEGADIGAVTNNISGWPIRRRISDGVVVDQISITTFERVHFTGSSKNDFFQGLSGNDQLFGGAGVDALKGGNGNDWIDGGAGADTLTGETGNDTYVVDDLGDTVVETSGQGTDTVRASVDFTLPVNVEILVLTGDALNGTGNTLSNAITGNSLNNYLRGESGNDLLNGGGGAGEIDRLNGGPGADTFALGDAGVRFYDDGSPSTPGLNGYAIIEDFTPSQSDKLRLAGSAAQYFLGASPVPGVPGTALYHDSNGNAALDPASDELIAILVSPETLTVANTISNSTYTQPVDFALIGLTSPLQIIVTNNSVGLFPAVEFSIFEPVTNSVLLEIQSSSDLGLTDPWLTIASKNAGGAWSGTATVSVSPPDNGRVTVRVTDTQTLTQRPWQFYRAKISAP